MGISSVDMSTTLLGHPVSMPIGISPTALHKIAHKDGEVATVKAAGSADTCMVLSIASTCTLEDVASASPHSPKWFLIYMLYDKEYLKSLIKRAEDCGFQAIVFVVDAPITGESYDGMRNRKRNIPFLPPGITPPLLDFSKMKGKGNKNSFSDVIEHNISWETVNWLKKQTKLPLVLKGIMTGEDAKLAVDHGVDAIIVSNHGGRQLDSVSATIDVLPEIVDAVQGKLEVYMDGGVRLGTDVFKALALGARAVFLGRAVIWGLACKGEEGVSYILELLREELRKAMWLSGCRSVGDISRNHVTKS
ncbi:2-Hydroxyacid oxidase 1 [Nematostella vectensis]|uniref:2-Hydroxyacid oxidase 1 n=1 Tax=Nematostella vectensis TaxID=45351 RepID=UPI0020779034|nr:2-Hydroxyacid oxidase 1 [Nematostella vectensis]